MWGDNTNGLSSTGLLRPTDRSSAIRRNYNYNYNYNRSRLTKWTDRKLKVNFTSFAYSSLPPSEVDEIDECNVDSFLDNNFHRQIENELLQRKFTKEIL